MLLAPHWERQLQALNGVYLLAQEEEFQDKWRLMKQGKNKPLEADEVEFLDSVAEQEALTARRKREEEAQELESFQVCMQAGAYSPCLD